MGVVGIRELKARLSACLREVARGEVFLVTDRDRVVATRSSSLGTRRRERSVSEVVYLDTSVVLRAVLERGITPVIEKRLGEARYLLRPGSRLLKPRGPFTA